MKRDVQDAGGDGLSVCVVRPCQTMRLSCLFAALSVAAVVVFFAQSVQAEIITFGFSGAITGVYDPDGVFDGSIVSGGAFSGTYSFESTTPDAQPDDPGLGDYVMAAPLPPMVISVGDYSFVGGTSRILIEDGRAGHDKDSMKVRGNALAGRGVVGTSCSMWLVDESATAFDNTALPLKPPLLSGFNLTPGLTFDGVSTANLDCSFAGVIESLVLIPEPTTMALVLIGWPICCWRLRRPRV